MPDCRPAQKADSRRIILDIPLRTFPTCAGGEFTRLLRLALRENGSRQGMEPPISSSMR